MTAPRVSMLAGVMRPFPRLAREAGLAPEKLLRACGIPAGDLSRAGARLPLEAGARLLARAAADSGRADFGLQLGLAHHPSDLGALGYCWLSAPNVAAALAAGQEFEAVAQGGAAFTLVTAKDQFTVCYTAAGLAPSLQPQDAEFTFAVLLTALRAITHLRIRPLAVAFAHAAPPSDAAHRVAFGAPLTFHAGANRMVFPAAMLRTPIPTHDAQLFAILRDYLAHLAAALREPRDFRETVSRAVRADLATGTLSVASLARALNVSPRTLQRRLHSAGTSLRAEIAAARRAMAPDILARPGARAADAARRLGFADAGSLRRALRKESSFSEEKEAKRLLIV